MKRAVVTGANIRRLDDILTSVLSKNYDFWAMVELEIQWQSRVIEHRVT